MSKLLSLKQWLSLPEAAGHLQTIFNEQVTVADVLRFCTSGHLTLSVNFVNHGRAKLARKVPLLEAGFTLIPDLEQSDPPTVTIYGGEEVAAAFQEWLKLHPEEAAQITERKQSVVAILRGDAISTTECVTRGEGVSVLKGLWDLTMIGAERLDVEQRLQQETGGPEVELICLDGVLLSRPDGTFARLQAEFTADELPPEDVSSDASPEQRRMHEERRYYPAGELPSDAPMVVRPEALLEFIEAVSGGRSGRTLTTRERNNFLRIFVALAKQAKIDLKEGGKAAVQIEAAVLAAGFEGPKEKTIRAILAEARDID
ncbi:hypothetical protein ACFW0P_16150 [Lysobacter soli]|uniref:hypothetical protein n=1 Tax=Lysobacter soli TaxID=453783 RepID=UPI003678C910